jgi:amino acid transporter
MAHEKYGPNGLEGSQSSQERKGYPTEYTPEYPEAHGQYLEDVNPHHNLHRGLKARQVAMIAIGGAIGTGLIIGT